MYHLQSAKVKPVDQNGYWLDEDISAKTIGQLFNDYKQVLLFLTNDAFQETVYLYLSDIAFREDITDSLTLDAWFATISNSALPTFETLPDLTPQLVKYTDVWRSNYDVTKVPSDYNPNMTVPESLKTDLLITRSDIDYMLMGRRCLVTVNGLLHYTEGSVHGLYVRDGAKSSRIANKTQVGILSFNAIGDISLVRFSPSMIAQPNNMITLKETVYLDLGIDLTNKTVLLSLGGYLHAVDNCYNVVGNSSIKINWLKIPYVNRYFEQRKLMDVSPLQLTVSPSNPAIVNVDEFLSDATITRYLQLSQSFFIVIDNKDFFCDKRLLEDSHLPGIYYNQEEPKFPMQIALGRLGNYWKYYDDQKWVMQVEDNEYKYYMFETIPWKETVNIDDTLQSNKPRELADAYLMTMGVP